MVLINHFPYMKYIDSITYVVWDEFWTVVVELMKSQWKFLYTFLSIVHWMEWPFRIFSNNCDKMLIVIHIIIKAILWKDKWYHFGVHLEGIACFNCRCRVCFVLSFLFFFTAPSTNIQAGCRKSKCRNFLSQYTPCYSWHKSSYSQGMSYVIVLLLFILSFLGVCSFSCFCSL